jgi:hypothetical protein
MPSEFHTGVAFGAGADGSWSGSYPRGVRVHPVQACIGEAEVLMWERLRKLNVELFESGREASREAWPRKSHQFHLSPPDQNDGSYPVSETHCIIDAPTYRP